MKMPPPQIEYSIEPLRTSNHYELGDVIRVTVAGRPYSGRVIDRTLAIFEPSEPEHRYVIERIDGTLPVTQSQIDGYA